MTVPHFFFLSAQLLLSHCICQRKAAARVIFKLFMTTTCFNPLPSLRRPLLYRITFSNYFSPTATLQLVDPFIIAVLKNAQHRHCQRRRRCCEAPPPLPSFNPSRSLTWRRQRAPGNLDATGPTALSDALSRTSGATSRPALTKSVP